MARRAATFLLAAAFLTPPLEAAAEMRTRPANWARSVIGSGVKNLFQVSDGVFRSEQPDREEMADLERFGIRSVLSLRKYHDDEDEAGGTGLAVHRVPMDAGEIRDAEVVEALRIITAAEKPVLVHCWHGSDRTGLVIAMYRLVFEGWSRPEAVDELVNGGFGYHSDFYPNIQRYLEEVNLEEIRKAVFPPDGGK